jgi:diguanylate cyclase (GGDEF)-like protein/putative nucleotidyltransferase with HDIG domain
VQQRAKGVRPVLLLIVYGVFLVVVGVTATAQTTLVSLHFTTGTLNSVVAADAAIVRTFANEALIAADLGPDVPAFRAAALETTLRTLASHAGIERIDLRSPAGDIRLSTDADARGTTPPASAAQAEAAGGRVSALIVEPRGSPESLAGMNADHALVRVYLPLQDAGGSVHAVVAIWRDARPLLAAIADAQEQVLAVTLTAALVAAVLLFLVFRSAQDRISRQTAQLLDSTRTDALTGMLNHGALVTGLAEAIERARQRDGSIGVALIDLDNFRLLNDTHGHESGDQALLTVAALVAAHRPVDAMIGRYGPDEFLVIAPAEAIVDLEPAVGRLREALAAHSLQFDASERLPITVSAGVASYPADGDSVTELLAVVARELVAAKASGGDAVRVANRVAPPAEAGAFGVLQGLVFAIDAKDRYTKRHSEDVARYSVFLAQQVGLDAETIEAVRIAGLLHDVGKVAIPESILRKPAKLTADEMDVVKQHVALGDAIVRDLVSIDVVRHGIRHHHERWDGRGYLDGLAGDDIPLVARILAVGDAFSAMTTTRPYRKALSIEEALRRLLDAASTQLDEQLATTFVTAIETVPGAPLPGAEPVGGLWVPARRVA